MGESCNLKNGKRFGVVGGGGLRQSLERDEGRGGGSGRLWPSYGRPRAVGAPWDVDR